MACEAPAARGASLSLWDCKELAGQLMTEKVVARISGETVRRILNSHRLKPWRHHLWLSPKVPRDEAFAQTVTTVCGLYTRQLLPHEVVLCLDEKTNLQPRRRTAPTLPATPGTDGQPGTPVRVEHEYERAGLKAVCLLAAFDTRTGQVYHTTTGRCRQDELIGFLEQLHRELPPEKTHVYLVLDNSPVHRGKRVRQWIADHPRFALVFLPVHCSWMNQIEQFFGIVQRKRLAIADFDNDQALAAALHAFIAHWNTAAHPFHWTARSFEKTLAACNAKLAA